MYGLKTITLSTLIIGLLSIVAAPVLAEEKSGFDKAWSYLTLYENEEGALQKFALVGRAQLDAVWVNPDGLDEEGNSLENLSDTRWRRFRFRGSRGCCYRGLPPRSLPENPLLGVRQ